MSKTVHAKHFFRIVAKQRMDEWTTERASAFLVSLPNPFLRSFDDGAEFFCGFEHSEFRSTLYFSALGYFQRALHDRRQALQVSFHHVIGSAPLERFDRSFLANRARNKDERYIRQFFASDGQCSQAIESGY